MYLDFVNAILLGFMDHIMRYDGFASTLASQHSISVYGFDQRGFGRTAKPSSQGVTSLPQALDDLDFFLKKCRNRAGPTKPLFLLGQSNGGQQSLIYSCTRLQSSLLAGVIAASPMIDQAPESKANKLAVAAGALAAHLLPKFKLNVGVTPEVSSAAESHVLSAHCERPGYLKRR